MEYKKVKFNLSKSYELHSFSGIETLETHNIAGELKTYEGILRGNEKLPIMSSFDGFPFYISHAINIETIS